METSSGELPQILCLLRDSLPLDQEELDACFDPDRFARKTNPAQEEAIASQWRRASRANPRLFNGSKFRYAGVRWTDRPQLQLGLTSYREHIGTNLRSGQRLLQEAGSAVYGDRQAFLADPLAVGAVLLTSDNRLVLIRRALWVGEYPGRVDRPGGHAEPDELPRPAAPSGEEPSEEERHEAALGEVFESVRREVRDELGVPMTHLSRAYLAGILRDGDLGGRPTLEFILRCSLPSSELERLYNEGKHCEADESLGLVLLTRDELFSEQRAVFRVPDLTELDVEYPWKKSTSENGAAESAAAAATAAAAAAAAAGSNTGGKEGEGETAQSDVAQSGALQSEGAVTATVASSGEAVEPKVNCDVSAPLEPVMNCEPAVMTVVGAEEQEGKAECGVSEASEVDPKVDLTTATDLPPPTAQPPAAKFRQQPPKKRRRNRKDKRGAAVRAEAAQPAKKADDPVPALVTEAVAKTESVTPDSVQPPHASQTEPHAPNEVETQPESVVPGSVADSGQATDRLDISQQNAIGDSQESDAVDASASSTEAPMSSAGDTASSAKAQAPSDVEALPSAVAETSSSAAAAVAITSTTDVAAEASTSAANVTEPAGGDSDEIVVVQQNGVVLLKSGGEVTETTMPPAAQPSGQIETHAEVVNNPEGAEVAAGAETEKTAEELERQKKAELWEQMTPGCKAALILLKAANLKGFVFRF